MYGNVARINGMCLDGSFHGKGNNPDIFAPKKLKGTSA
jgi:hypothetical protein